MPPVSAQNFRAIRDSAKAGCNNRAMPKAKAKQVQEQKTPRQSPHQPNPFDQNEKDSVVLNAESTSTEPRKNKLMWRVLPSRPHMAQEKTKILVTIPLLM